MNDTPKYAGTLWIFLWLISCSLKAQEFTEKISKEFTPTKPANATTLAVFNINGFVRVEGYSGNTVQVEISKKISADDAQTVEVGKKELKLRLEQVNDSILVYLEEPYCSFQVRHNRKDKDPGSRCPSWNCCQDRHIDYDFSLDFTIKVPNAINLYVSTVNKGDVVVKDVSGSLRTFNVNGPITIKNAKGTTEVRTVNGDVEANYTAVPLEKSSYYTLNGDINVEYPANLSADLQFKNTNGEFYTDFPDATVLPAEVTRNRENSGGGTVYKINKTASLRIGSGGKVYRFETFNGNIYVKKK